MKNLRSMRIVHPKRPSPCKEYGIIISKTYQTATGKKKLVVIVPMDLPRHDHHPQIEDSIDELEGECSFPAVTCRVTVRNPPVYTMMKAIRVKGKTHRLYSASTTPMYPCYSLATHSPPRRSGSYHSHCLSHRIIGARSR